MPQFYIAPIDGCKQITLKQTLETISFPEVRMAAIMATHDFTDAAWAAFMEEDNRRD